MAETKAYVLMEVATGHVLAFVEAIQSGGGRKPVGGS